MKTVRQIKGAMAYHSGMAAEESVARVYELAGRSILARRWRGTAGEVDLIAKDGAGFIFIEVKQSHSHAAAANMVSPKQIARIFDTATEYVTRAPLGMMSEMRFDVALVDGMGRVEVLENALAA